MDTNTVTLIAASIAAVTSILSAIIAVIIGVYSANRVAKQKIADYRREWIETIRLKVSELTALRFMFDECRRSMASLDDLEKIEELHRERLKIMQDMGERLSFIQLCLNSNEPTHAELEKSLEFLVRGSEDEHDKHRNDGGLFVLSHTRKVLKNEWTRLKSEV